MSNTGTFCVLVNSRKRAKELQALVVRAVEGSVTLHNLQTQIVPEVSTGPYVLVGECDCLTVEEARKLFSGRLLPGEFGPFVVDMTWGERWTLVGDLIAGVSA